MRVQEDQRKPPTFELLDSISLKHFNVGWSTNICFAFLLCSELMLIYSPFYNWAAQAIGRLVPGCNTMMNVPIRIIFCQTAAEARTEKNRAGRPISSNNLIYWQNKLGFTEAV